MDNGLVRVALDKIVSTDRRKNGHENCICTTSYTHKHYVLISEEYLQKYRSNTLANNDLVKFTSSREDNSTNNDSMVMKIAHAQLHMYTNIKYKFQSSTCKTVGEKLRTKLCPQTDGHENCICTISCTHKHYV